MKSKNWLILLFFILIWKGNCDSLIEEEEKKENKTQQKVDILSDSESENSANFSSSNNGSTTSSDNESVNSSPKYEIKVEENNSFESIKNYLNKLILNIKKEENKINEEILAKKRKVKKEIEINFPVIDEEQRIKINIINIIQHFKIKYKILNNSILKYGKSNLIDSEKDLEILEKGINLLIIIGEYIKNENYSYLFILPKVQQKISDSIKILIKELNEGTEIINELNISNNYRNDNKNYKNKRNIKIELRDNLIGFKENIKGVLIMTKQYLNSINNLNNQKLFELNLVELILKDLVNLSEYLIKIKEIDIYYLSYKFWIIGKKIEFWVNGDSIYGTTIKQNLTTKFNSGWPIDKKFSNDLINIKLEEINFYEFKDFNLLILFGKMINFYYKQEEIFLNKYSYLFDNFTKNKENYKNKIFYSFKGLIVNLENLIELSLKGEEKLFLIEKYEYYLDENEINIFGQKENKKKNLNKKVNESNRMNDLMDILFAGINLYIKLQKWFTKNITDFNQITESYKYLIQILKSFKEKEIIEFEKSKDKENKKTIFKYLSEKFIVNTENDVQEKELFDTMNEVLVTYYKYVKENKEKNKKKKILKRANTNPKLNFYY